MAAATAAPRLGVGDEGRAVSRARRGFCAGVVVRRSRLGDDRERSSERRAGARELTLDELGREVVDHAEREIERDVRRRRRVGERAHAR